MNSLITKLRADRDSLKATLDALVDTADEQNRDFDSAEEANFNDGKEKLEALNKRLEGLENLELRNAEAAELSRKVDEATKNGTVKVKSEALTYRENGEHDFLRDVFAGQVRGDFGARERLARHTVEMETENRAVVTGDLGGLMVPKHLTALYAPVAHEGRPFANIVNRNPLEAMTVIIPKALTDVAVEVQANQLDTIVNSDPDVTDLTITASTIAGEVEVSRQSIDFGAFNSQMVYNQLFSRYAQKLDTEALVGPGTGGRVKGILNATGVNAVNGAAVTNFKQFAAKVSEAKTKVYKAFTGPATHIVMNSDLAGWVLGQTDSEGRPLIGYGYSNPSNVSGNEQSFLGLTIVIDDNIPSTANGSLAPLQKAIVCNASQVYLFETNGGTPFTITADQPGASQLKVKFTAYGYVQFTAEVNPKAVSIISGLALA